MAKNKPGKGGKTSKSNTPNNGRSTRKIREAKTEKAKKAIAHIAAHKGRDEVVITLTPKGAAATDDMAKLVPEPVGESQTEFVARMEKRHGKNWQDHVHRGQKTAGVTGPVDHTASMYGHPAAASAPAEPPPSRGTKIISALVLLVTASVFLALGGNAMGWW